MLRLRLDLIAAPVEMSGAPTWVVKDPLTLEHYHFSPEEYALMELLRRPISLAELERELGISSSAPELPPAPETKPN